MIRIGVSGWRYPPWRGVFYPKGLRQADELAYAASKLSSVELNGTFYSLQKPEYFRAWADAVPEDFVFAVKGGRFITHMKKLAGGEAVLANFFASGVLALGPRLGPFLWQLPPTLAFDAERAGCFLASLPRTSTAAAELATRHDERLADRAWTTTDADRPLRHAVEVRHASWAAPEAVALLREHDVALVVADTAGKFPAPEEVTADFVYVRLHGDVELYTSGYDDAAIGRWAERIEVWARDRDVYVYFDNDVKAHAPRDALALRARLGV